MTVNERQDDWDAHFPHVEFSYNKSVSAATGLAPNEVHMNRLPCLPLTVFEHPLRSWTSKPRSRSAGICLPGCRPPAALVRPGARATRAQYCPSRKPKFCAVRRAQATPHLRHWCLGVGLQHCRYHPARGHSRHGRLGPQSETLAQLDGAIQDISNRPLPRRSNP